MQLVQILLPVRGPQGNAFPHAEYSRVAEELTEQFGGMTAYTRAPASGLWQEGDGETARDDIVVYEVMVEELDRAWWERFRADLERRFAQQELVVRAQPIERL